MATTQFDNAAIRFLKAWRNRARGEINTTLGRGVMATLVRHNFAEWVRVTERAEQIADATPPKRRRGRPRKHESVERQLHSDGRTSG